MRLTTSPNNGPWPAAGRSFLLLLAAGLLLPASTLRAADGFPARTLRPFLDAHCLGCHDADTKKGGLDLEKLSTDFGDPAAFDAWVKVHDKLRAGEMPPKATKRRPTPAETEAVVGGLDGELAAADRRRIEGQGRSVFRRLNRTEYENTLRDLLDLPGLGVRDLLPEDGRANGYDKSGAGLDLSHVQLAKYLDAADAALDLAVATQADRPEPYHRKLYPGAQYDFSILLLNGDAVFLKDGKYDPVLFPPLRGNAPKSLGEYVREKAFPYAGSVGVFRHEDDAFLGRFGEFTAIYPGRYRLRVSLWAFHWDRGEVRPAAQTEAASLTANGRLVGYFDAPSLKPTVHETEVWLNQGEYLQFNAASLWPIRVSELKGRAAEYVGPGIAIDWLEVEGPLYDRWPSASHRRLFGDLPLGPLPQGKGARPPKRVPPRQIGRDGQNGPGKYTFATVASPRPEADADRLLRDFLRRAFRRPVTAEEVGRYLGLVRQRLAAGVGFEEAMRTAYKAALCSPDFLFLRETPGRLDDWALAARLSYFLWESMPDDELFTLAEQGKLHDPGVLRAQTERMLNHPKAERFVTDFLDQWLDLREIDSTSPDRRLYPEFGPYLRDSMLAESRAFFRELLRNDLGAANLVRSDFALLNQKLAEHYGIPGVVGSQFRRVPLPADRHRGGFLTQASVLKVTANGTVTSPVKRGVWVQRKIVGRPPQPPPPDVPAIDPDVRGATTIREQLAKHRLSATCAACHAKIDPPGFALESFDVIGGWRDRYRSLGQGTAPPTAATRGHEAFYRLAQPVDPAGETSGGRPFHDVEEFRANLLEDPRLIARNLAGQLLTYATGAPVGYADRAAVEGMLDRTAPGGHGIRSLIHEVVQSDAFQCK
jgi:mono/diheme cytochrome c family protein